MFLFNHQAPAHPHEHSFCGNNIPHAYLEQAVISPRAQKSPVHQDMMSTASFTQYMNMKESQAKNSKPQINSRHSMFRPSSPSDNLVPRMRLTPLPSYEIIFDCIRAPEEATYEASMIKTFNHIYAQQESLKGMANKEDLLEKTLSELTAELKIIRTNLEKKVKNTEIRENQASEIKLVATSEMVVSQICPKNSEFIYSLQAVGDFPRLLCREKAFSLKLELIDLRSGTRVMNPNKIDVSLALYTVSNPPKLITINTTGGKPFKGDIISQLTNGTVSFSKIYPNEVSSHYMTGTVFLVAFPKFTSEYAEKMKIVSQYCGDMMIDPSLVRPWVLDRLVIKAKKSKE
jgi:hypothetical protein